MRKKNTLPESLELLLDTMCNTFGGIMFIAISLIVISQLANRKILTMTAEQYSKQAMERLEQQVRQVEQDIVLLNEKIAAFKYKSHTVSENKKKLIEQFFKVSNELVRQKADKEQLELKIAAAQAKLKRLQDPEKQLRREIAEAKERYNTNRDLYEKQRKQFENDIRNLEKELEKTQPKKLRFAVDEDTGLKPYFVLVSDSKIYRAGDQRNWNQDEVIVRENADESVLKMIPRNGTALSTTPEIDLNHLFRNVSKSDYFIFLCSDLDSYTSLFVVKQYLRIRGYKVYLNVNPEFMFSISSNVRYRASD